MVKGLRGLKDLGSRISGQGSRAIYIYIYIYIYICRSLNKMMKPCLRLALFVQEGLCAGLFQFTRCLLL